MFFKDNPRKMIQNGAPKIAFSWFISGLTLVYGRYFTLVNGDYFMVYKPTYSHHWVAPSCRKTTLNRKMVG